MSHFLGPTTRNCSVRGEQRQFGAMAIEDSFGGGNVVQRRGRDHGARRPTLGGLIRHAERFGTECVYETAEELGFPALELGYLARHLRRVDRLWRLTPDQRERLIEELLAAGTRRREIADMAGVSEKTVSRARQRGAEDGLQGPWDGLVEPKKRDKSRSHDERPGGTDSVPSGAVDELPAEPLRRASS